MHSASLAKGYHDLGELLRKFGIELSQSTLRTEERMNRSLMPDTKAIKYTTVSLSFNIEVSDSLCGYVRFLQLDITTWTMAVTHLSHISFCCHLIKGSGLGFTVGNSGVNTFLCCIHALYSAPRMHSYHTSYNCFTRLGKPSPRYDRRFSYY